jgi:hypothetical protein
VTILPVCHESTTVLPQPQSGCTPSPKTGLWLRVARVALEAVLGTGLGLLGEFAGAYVGLNIDILSHHESGAGFSVGAAFGAILAVAPGVWLGGSALAGDGAFGWTMLGGATGTVASAIVLGIKNNTATSVVAAALPVLGSILGYELSSNRRRQPSPVSVMPTIGPNSVGLAGVF